jgi:hypothetical protein
LYGVSVVLTTETPYGSNGFGYFMVKYRAATWVRHARDGQLNNRRGYAGREPQVTGLIDREIVCANKAIFCELIKKGKT